jgi:hypothetical protein
MICNKYPKLKIKYIFLGQRNINEINKLYWRDAGFAINYGLKHCSGELVLINEAEVYNIDCNQINKMIEPHLTQQKLITHPKRVYIDTGILLNQIEKGIEPTTEVLSKIENFYHAHFHYSIMLYKKELINIGGWDEDFLGSCYTDGDINDRLEMNGMKFVPLDLECIHLFHPRINCIGWDYNKRLYEERKNIIIRNQDKQWGMNIWHNIF